VLAMECCRLFFGSNIMNHVDFLKYITTLGRDDHVLAIEMLENFQKKTDERQRVEPFYQEHEDFERNEVHIAQIYQHLCGLRDHTPNIYQAAFLEPESWIFVVTAVVCFLIQMFILVSLMLFALDDSFYTDDVTVLGAILATSVFFCFMCRAEVTAAWSFWQSTEYIHGKSFRMSWTLYMDLIMNVGVGVLSPAFNVFFLLKSASLIDAVLNSTAIFFVLELDDIMNPGLDYLEYLATGSHNYIMAPSTYDIQVSRVQSDQVQVVGKDATGQVPAQEDSSEDALINYHDCYVYAARLDMDTVVFNCIDADFQVKNIKYTITGKDAKQLMEPILGFQCFRRYHDIHP